jgi:hypothetical protein
MQNVSGVLVRSCAAGVANAAFDDAVLEPLEGTLTLGLGKVRHTQRCRETVRGCVAHEPGGQRLAIMLIDDGEKLTATVRDVVVRLSAGCRSHSGELDRVFLFARAPPCFGLQEVDHVPRRRVMKKAIQRDAASPIVTPWLPRVLQDGIRGGRQSEIRWRPGKRTLQSALKNVE